MGTRTDNEQADDRFTFEDNDRFVEDWIFRAMEAESGIYGWGYGRKRVGGQKTTELAVTIFVSEKWHRRLIDPAGLVPERLGRLRTDVLPIGAPRLMNATTPVPRPVPWGCRISHWDGLQGTLGCTAVGDTDSRTYVLSNCHVLADSGSAATGDAIVQPPISLMVDRDTIADLARFVPVKTTETTPLRKQKNYVDAAIATVRPADASAPNGYVEATYTTNGLSLTSWRRTEDITEGLAVCKVGGMTGYRAGVVEHLNVNLALPFGNGTAMFRRQIFTSDIGEPGDSGSLVTCPADGSAIGLLFGQSAPDEYGHNFTLVNPIQTVQRLLAIKVSPTVWVPPGPP